MPLNSTGKKVTKLNEKVLTKEQMCDAIEEAQHVTEKIDAQLPPNDPHRSALGLSTPGSPGTPALDAKLVAGPSESTQQQTVETTGTSSVDGATGFVQALQQELGTAKASWEAQEESYRQFQAQIEQEESKDRTAKVRVISVVVHKSIDLGSARRRMVDLSYILARRSGDFQRDGGLDLWYRSVVELCYVQHDRYAVQAACLLSVLTYAQALVSRPIYSDASHADIAKATFLQHRLPDA